VKPHSPAPVTVSRFDQRCSREQTSSRNVVHASRGARRRIEITTQAEAPDDRGCVPQSCARDQSCTIANSFGGWLHTLHANRPAQKGFLAPACSKDRRFPLSAVIGSGVVNGGPARTGPATKDLGSLVLLPARGACPSAMVRVATLDASRA